MLALQITAIFGRTLIQSVFVNFENLFHRKAYYARRVRQGAKKIFKKLKFFNKSFPKSLIGNPFYINTVDAR